jgi:hypothetical protein
MARNARIARKIEAYLLYKALKQERFILNGIFFIVLNN